MTDLPTVPCTYCGTDTTMTGTQLCDRCWELQGRITDVKPSVLWKIIKDVKRKALSGLLEGFWVFTTGNDGAAIEEAPSIAEHYLEEEKFE